MTNISSGLNTEKLNRPFLLKPAGKDYLWGGSRLKDDFSKNIDLSPLAETWECSTHPDGLSTVASGIYSGLTLAEVLKAHPEYLGTHALPDGGLPILIKLIDAKQNLSVQVHPDDAYAAAHENNQLGKSEMWYVLDAAKDAQLIYGLYHDTARETLRRAVQNGSIEKYLQKVPVKKDDVFYVEAGTIHAICAGALVAEIQESSNLTYRIYDYDRVDKNGNRRPLHIEKGLAAANLKSSVEPKQPLRVFKYTPGTASELLCRCKYFQAYRMLVNTERRQTVYYQTDSVSFSVLLCISGCGTLELDGEVLNVFKGDCIFFPVNSVRVKLLGQLQLLDVRG